ncbi:autoinducer-2 (AI-2) modifying protein LsrG [Planctomycetes bacterium MalM25]|nr:autoinducer-2 (AI-2) modifying protein LsrG [Planctomycetes bacterium MalM25]
MSRLLPLAAALLALTSTLTPAAKADEGPLHPIAAEVAEQLADPDQPFTLIVNFSVQDAEKFIAVMTDPIVQTAKEEGNVNYRLSQSLKQPTEFTLYEQWQDLASLDSHLKQPYLVKLVKDFHEALAAPPKLTVQKTIQVGE